VSAVAESAPAPERVGVGEIAALRATVEDLRSQLAAVRADVDRLLAELGVSR
jgi:hypothetical protein